MYKNIICTLASKERIINKLTKKRWINFGFLMKSNKK